MKKITYFIGDQHFKEKDTKKIKKFINFIEYIKGCDSLFIVGDLFDFYFEYKTQIPKTYFEIFFSLRLLKKSGTKIYYLPGNHDFWVNDFFDKFLGIKTYRSPIEINIQGKKIFITHGDGLWSNPLKFTKIKLFIWLFYLIHPDIAYFIAKKVSKLSSKINSKRKINLQKYYLFAEQKFKEGIDAVIFGHIHNPTHIRYKGKDFLFVGDWTKHFSYVKLNDGKFTLCNW